MKPMRVIALGCALWLLGAGTASAAWNNVFQTCCFGCRQKQAPVASYYAASPVVAPCMQYVQRSYYQPVTTYKQQTYYQPVTSYKTSYYYEPYTAQRYTTYYDPCTGCPKQCCQTETRYRMRSQCNAVTEYVARCSMVPETNYRQMTYYEAVPTCPDPCAGGMQAGVSAPPQSAEPPYGYGAPPGYANPPAGVSDGSGSSSDGGRINPQATPNFVPPASAPPASYRSRPPYPAAIPNPNFGAPPQPTTVTKPDRMTMGRPAPLTGQVLRNDFAPRSGAEVLFVSRTSGGRQTARADQAGNFRVALASGTWDVYLATNNGQPVYHNQYAVDGSGKPLTIVSR